MKDHSVLTLISSASSLFLICSAPLERLAVLGWQLFRSTHGRIISQQGHHGLGVVAPLQDDNGVPHVSVKEIHADSRLSFCPHLTPLNGSVL